MGRAGARPALPFARRYSNAVRVHAADGLAWRDARNTSALVVHLDRWLDEHSTLPRNAVAPGIRLIDKHSLESLSGSPHSAYGGNLRGAYDPDTRVILLVHPWDPRDPRDVSVLLHELIHHRQADPRHWYCQGAQELPAYRLQQAWLAELGLELDVDKDHRHAESGCTPRDIHPD